MIDLKIEALTSSEKRALLSALTALLSTSKVESFEHWAAGVMLENGGDFVERLMLRSK